MKKSEWSDNELEQLLRQMPKIKDHRDPHDIYQSLSLKVKKRKRPVWIVPSVASVAAVLLLFLIAPNIWQGIDQGSDKKMESNMAMDPDAQNTELTKKLPENNDNESLDTNDNMGIASLEAPVSETAIYVEDIAIDQEIITYWMPDENAQIIVPVSVVVPKEENKTWLDLFNAYSEKLTEDQWGLSEYYPLNATLSKVDDQTLNVDVPEGHSYGEGSASESTFVGILKEMLRGKNNIQKITLSTNGKPGIMFGNYGEKTDVELSEPEGKHSYYLFNPNNSNLPFLVPSNTLYTDIESAFGAMFSSVEENYGLKSPLNFNFTIKSKSQPNLVLNVDDKVQFTNEPQFINAIEAILLTAKEFGFETVKFENTSVDQIGRFNLQNELKVPVAPNKVFLQ
jgi:hypothetical protein